MRALISVSNKKGLVPFAQALSAAGVDILSTGGTYNAIRAAGIPVIEVSEYTGFPEMMGGRLKTLHPKVHGGILGRLWEDAAVMEENGIVPIDLVIVNLYPFAETVANPDCDLDTAVENIDIGGPTMIRAAAKNWRRVAVVVDPEDYYKVAVELAANGEIVEAVRYELMKKAFRLTAEYDGVINHYFNNLLVGSR